MRYDTTIEDDYMIPLRLDIEDNHSQWLVLLL